MYTGKTWTRVALGLGCHRQAAGRIGGEVDGWNIGLVDECNDGLMDSSNNGCNRVVVPGVVGVLFTRTFLALVAVAVMTKPCSRLVPQLGESSRGWTTAMLLDNLRKCALTDKVSTRASLADGVMGRQGRAL